MIRILTAVLLAASLVVLSSPAQGGGKFNKKVKIGQKAPAFNNLPGTIGGEKDVKMSLSDLKNKDVVVVVITCNHCPVAVRYEDKIIALAEKYAAKPGSKVGLVAINVNNLPADKLDKMKIRAKSKGFNFPYLYDESQTIARKLGATVTPEFYVLNKNREIVYMGAMDRNGKGPNLVAQAINSALKGETPAVAETRPFGCSVKYERK